MFEEKIALVRLVYNQVVKNKDNALEKFNTHAIKIFIIFILSTATALWIICTIGWSYESIRGNYKLFKEVYDCTICHDGWISHSYGPGTCSWHGGVEYYKYANEYAGTHIANPEKYYPAFLISLTIILIPSIFNSVYRLTAISFQLTGIYYVCNTLFSILKGVFFILKMPIEFFVNLCFPSLNRKYFPTFSFKTLLNNQILVIILSIMFLLRFVWALIFGE